MSCPTCGHSQTSGSKIALWICGGVAAAFFAFCILIVICLAAVASIGESADDQFQKIDRQLETARLNAQSENSNSLIRHQK